MSGNDFKSRISKLDSFWDLDSLVVKKGIGKKPPETFSRSPSREVSSDDGKQAPRQLTEVKVSDTDGGSTIKRYIIPKQSKVSEVPEREYSPENSLIHNVKVYSWNADYNYFDDFYCDVKKYFKIFVREAEHVPFFAYVPQYSQMSKAQAKWYFHFRDRVRSGEYPKSDYSYILLYCFELISSTELMPPSEIMKKLTCIWKNYRRVYPQLNKYLAEWIVDFGLINATPFPQNIVGSELAELMQHSTLKEFYASSVYRERASFVKLILQFCSAHDHKKSRYYEKHAALYDDFIEKTLEHLFDRGLLEGFSTEDCTITRQAFIGAHVVYKTKKKIEISYCSFSRTNDFRYVVGDIVKYCENKIRAHVSVKSRLTVYSLDESMRRGIDEFASVYFVNVERPRKVREPEINEYDKLYDVPKKAFSLAEAKEIESESWTTTERLIEAFAEQEEPTGSADMLPEIIKEEGSDEATESVRENEAPLAPYKEFLRLVLRRELGAQRAYARERGEMLEAVADAVNDIATELWGDVLIEECDGGYAPIEEYISLIENEVR